LKIKENNSVDTKGGKITKSYSVGPGVGGGVSSLSTLTTNNLSGASLSRVLSEQIVNSVKEDTINTTTTNDVKSTAGVYITTKDAYTLTDGPTIYITDEVEKIAKFCIQQSNIPSVIMDELIKKIDYNNGLNKKIEVMENEVEYIKDQNEKNMQNTIDGGVHGRQKSTKNNKKMNRDEGDNTKQTNVTKLSDEIAMLRSMIKSVRLNETFIPNKPLHLEKWANSMNTENVFSCDLDESVINEIMLLSGIADSWKVLLMMGIGVFINHPNIAYTEIMKKLADEQRLYMIIASSDYIYGTNYQFCHGYLSKDLNLTQEKIIQAMGRIGRNNIQQNYTIRFRDDSQIMKLFTNETDKPEIKNMNRLFNSEIV
jgi:hypothetical protein